MSAAVRLLPTVSVPLDAGEVDAILLDAARTMARHGWSASRIAGQFGLSLATSQQLVDEARESPGRR
jgi:hypothetical protein